MQTRPLSQCGAVVIVPEMLLHLVPANLDAVRAGSLEQKGLGMHPGLEIHFEPVVERGGVSRKPDFEESVVQELRVGEGKSGSVRCCDVSQTSTPHSTLVC